MVRRTLKDTKIVIAKRVVSKDNKSILVAEFGSSV